MLFLGNFRAYNLHERIGYHNIHRYQFSERVYTDVPAKVLVPARSHKSRLLDVILRRYSDGGSHIDWWEDVRHTILLCFSDSLFELV